MCVGCKCQSCAAASVRCDRTEILLQSEELFSPVPGVDTDTTYRQSSAVLRCDKQAHRTDQASCGRALLCLPEQASVSALDEHDMLHNSSAAIILGGHA